MRALVNFYQCLHQRAFAVLQHLDGVPNLLLRLILAPVMMQAGYNKFMHFSDTVSWFGNPDWGLGLPFPTLLAFMAAGTELVGGALLVVGLATRLMALPLMFTMLVAAVTVHLQNGWLAISDASSWLANDRVLAAATQKQRAIELLQTHGNYDWLTQNGSITILNNGIEFAATYFVMLAVLFFYGGGRYVSIDYWIAKFTR